MDRDMNKFMDPEAMVSCPYNEAHQVTRKRMATHLTKCRKQYPDLARELRTCTYNFIHKIPAAELAFHEEICSDRETYYNHAYQVGQEPNPAVAELEKNLSIPIDVGSCSEDWSTETVPRGTNIIKTIQKNAERRGVLKNHTNEPPAVRKAKREEDYQRNLERTRAEVKILANQNVMRSSVDISTSSQDDVRYSSALSMVSDSSLNTAIDAASNRLQEFQLVTTKRGRGRAVSKPNTSTSFGGFGRSRSKREEN